MLQNGLDLFARHAGEPLEKVIHAGAIFQVCEESLHRNSRTSEDPGAADLSWSSLDRRALVPIKHTERLRDE